LKRVHIIGGKNHGKTTLVVDLVHELNRLGKLVGTIKHTHHHHELDTPGKDSHRHREAGAAVVGIASVAMNAVFWPPENNPTAEDSAGDGAHRVDGSPIAAREQKYAPFAPLFKKCDVVLVEGDTQTSATKLEVWRAEVGSEPLAFADPSIAAIITDDVHGKDTAVPSWSRQDILALAEKILAID
jgi:molybdopterin-guanine dinucleotide biosynthesis protein